MVALIQRCFSERESLLHFCSVLNNLKRRANSLTLLPDTEKLCVPAGNDKGAGRMLLAQNRVTSSPRSAQDYPGLSMERPSWETLSPRESGQVVSPSQRVMVAGNSRQAELRSQSSNTHDNHPRCNTHRPAPESVSHSVLKATQSSAINTILQVRKTRAPRDFLHLSE